jgi:hypothetical protein
MIYENVMNWTQNILYNRLCKSLTSKCDIDLEGRGTGVLLDILSYYCDYLCQGISISLELWRSSRSDTKYTL